MPIDLKLPAKVQVQLSLKQVGLLLLVVLAVAAIVFLAVTGQWRTVQTLMLKLQLKQRELELEHLDSTVKHNAGKVAADEKVRQEVEAERKRLERDRLRTQLEVEGKSHEEIVAALRARDF